MFKGIKSIFYPPICFLVIIAILYFTSTDKHNGAQYDHRNDIPNRFYFGHLNLEVMEMDDPVVLRRLQDYFLVPPLLPGPNHVYELASPDKRDPSMGQSKIIRELLGNKTNGFFIECGALDGETRSNTLYMERFLNWSGLLIEADPLNYDQMLRKGRKAWLSPTCLSKSTRAQTVTFKQNVNTGRISTNTIEHLQPGYVKVQCFPIYSYLLALNITHVDYFSLDVEGDELDVLKTLPFDKVNIETLSVEFAHVDSGKGVLKAFMESKGYEAVTEVTDPNWLANDFIFAKKHS